MYAHLSKKELSEPVDKFTLYVMPFLALCSKFLLRYMSDQLFKKIRRIWWFFPWIFCLFGFLGVFLSISQGLSGGVNLRGRGMVVLNALAY